MPRRRCFFTIPEVVAVILIIGLMAAFAVPMLKEASPAQQLEQAVLGFENFCSRVRYQAAENGADRIVCFAPSIRTFFMRDPIDPEEDTDVRDAAKSQFKWVLPEKFEMDESMFSSAAEEDYVEVFRFFPDGCASGHRDIMLRCGKNSRIITISPLTGLPAVKNTAGENP